MGDYVNLTLDDVAKLEKFTDFAQGKLFSELDFSVGADLTYFPENMNAVTMNFRNDDFARVCPQLFQPDDQFMSVYVLKNKEGAYSFDQSLYVGSEFCDDKRLDRLLKHAINIRGFCKPFDWYAKKFETSKISASVEDSKKLASAIADNILGAKAPVVDEESGRLLLADIIQMIGRCDRYVKHEYIKKAEGRAPAGELKFCWAYNGSWIDLGQEVVKTFESSTILKNINIFYKTVSSQLSKIAVR
jgi:hypothetical protein